MKELTYKRKFNLGNYQTFDVECTFNKDDQETLEQFLGRCLKEFNMAINNSEVVRKK